MLTFISLGTTALVFFLFWIANRPKPLTPEQKRLYKKARYERLMRQEMHREHGFKESRHPNLYNAQEVLYPIPLKRYLTPTEIRV